ncbi:proteasome subunit alpha [Granulicoccus phenolivorans]|uniref:proteasome subunit alpha n=1 Tax=Granulicoccus phenolivorans TaxID=266854 RepID=UPI00041C9ED9|nr:proteasome subunit alpha [Granulicoccus phenolivorans]
MSMPIYVAPEQQMKDRADFARKGIARGRSVAVLRYADGICFVAENRSQALHKVSEIYDRIGFAAVGRYNEFENLRIVGIRHADMRGYSYDRVDVTGRGLANAYAQLLGTIFSSGAEKPYEVELIVAELGETAEHDQIYRLTYDGSVGDEPHFAVMGGQADQIAESIRAHHRDDLSLAEVLKVAVEALAAVNPSTELGVEALEVALLDRTRHQPRKFRRLSAAALHTLLDLPTAGTTTAAEPGTGEPAEQQGTAAEPAAEPEPTPGADTASNGDEPAGE